MKSYKQLKEDLATNSTIFVDGIERPRFNSLGKPIYPTEEGIENFWKWFGDSQCVDKKGRPVVMYHGTITWEKDGKQLGDIVTFNRKASTEIVGRRPSIDQVGIWFSDKSDNGAEKYGNTVYPVYLKVLDFKKTTFMQLARTAYKLAHGDWKGMEKPGYPPNVTDVEPYRDYIQEQGYDSLKIIHDTLNKDSTEFANQNVFVVFEGTQVKSATGNNGKFSDSGNITEDLTTVANKEYSESIAKEIGFDMCELKEGIMVPPNYILTEEDKKLGEDKFAHISQEAWDRLESIKNSDDFEEIDLGYFTRMAEEEGW